MVSLRSTATTDKAARGFTIVELMVTIAIMVFLMLVTLPLAIRWVHGVQVSKSKDALMEGMAQARSFALRNPFLVQASASTPRPVVARLELDNAKASVVLNCPDSSLCNNTNSQIVWSSDLSRGADVTILFGGQSTATARFDKSGMLTAPVQYTISKGAEKDENTLH